MGERWDGGPHIETGVTHSIEVTVVVAMVEEVRKRKQGVPNPSHGDLAGLDA